jgi:hypothetical protein
MMSRMSDESWLPRWGSRLSRIRSALFGCSVIGGSWRRWEAARLVVRATRIQIQFARRFRPAKGAVF